MKQSTTVYGTPATMLTARSAVSESCPPTKSSAIATVACVACQKTRWRMGGEGLPFDVTQSTTSEPESDEVTK